MVAFPVLFFDHLKVLRALAFKQYTFSARYCLLPVDKTYYVIDNRGGDQLKTHWFEVSILQPSQMESRIESLTTTPSSRSSTSSTQGDSLPYYMQDSILEEQQFTGTEFFCQIQEFTSMAPTS